MPLQSDEQWHGREIDIENISTDFLSDLNEFIYFSSNIFISTFCFLTGKHIEFIQQWKLSLIVDRQICRNFSVCILNEMKLCGEFQWLMELSIDIFIGIEFDLSQTFGFHFHRFPGQIIVYFFNYRNFIPKTWILHS